MDVKGELIQFTDNYFLLNQSIVENIHQEFHVLPDVRLLIVLDFMLAETIED